MKLAVMIGAMGVATAPLVRQDGATATAPRSDPSMAAPIVVVAPGPRLWKLVRGASTVWVLGEIEPLPRGLKWNSAPVARVIKGADRVLLPPEGGGGVFDALRALARSRLPRGATLDTALPPDLDLAYRRVLARLGRDPNKPRRDKPAWAALLLEIDFVRSRNIDVSEPVRTVERLARQDHVKVQRIAFYKAGGVLGEVVGLPEAESQAALADAVAGVDFGLDHMAAAGQAWARGDLRAVRANSTTAQTPLIVLQHTLTGRRLGARSIDDTTAALRSALAGPGTTLVLLRLAALVEKGGALDRLRAEDVSITEPPL